MSMIEGKIAIITGAASGQGAAEARLFLSEGASVLMTDINPAGEALAEELGERAVFRKHDVSNLSEWEVVAKSAKELFGRVDILVNNAGIVGFEDVQSITPEAMQRYLDINLFGALYGIQTITPLMTNGGSVINIASTAALRGLPGLTGYGVSKWALRGLSRYAATECVGKNIRVNCVLPGGVDTPMTNNGADPGMVDGARAAVPMGRFATADEVARTVLFLASDQSSYMTGGELVVDGGQNA